MSAFLGEQKGAPGPNSVAQRSNNPLLSMARPLASNAPLSRHQPPLVSNAIVGRSRVASAQGTSAVRRGNSTGESVSQRIPRRAAHSTSSLTSRGRTNPTDAEIISPQSTTNPYLPRSNSLGSHFTSSYTADYDDEFLDTFGTEEPLCDDDFETNYHGNHQPIVDPSSIYPVRNTNTALPNRLRRVPKKKKSLPRPQLADPNFDD